MNAAAVAHAGTGPFLMSVTVNTNVLLDTSKNKRT